MASSIDPPRPPLAPVARVLAEAALQRQNWLLSAPATAGTPAAPGAAPADAAGPAHAAGAQPLPPGAAAAPSASQAPAAAPAPAAPPAQGERLTLSAQARQGLQAAADRTAALLAAPSGALSPKPSAASASAALPTAIPLTAAAQAQVATALSTSTSASATASAGTATAAPRAQAQVQTQAPPPGLGGCGGAAARAGAVAVQWPAQGVSAPLLRLLNTLVQQVAAPSGPAPRVLVAQPWPPGLGLPGDPQGADSAGDAASPALPALHIWRVAQGSLHTPEGVRGFTLTLRLPPAPAAFTVTASPAGPDVPLAPAASAAPMVPGAPAGLSAGFTGPLQALAPGVFALVLQGPGAAGQRTSALLSLELAPLPGSGAAAVVYGRDPLQARGDPWLAMAALQASGQWRADDEDEAHRRGDSLCRTPGCPYQGRAACVQPFCLALRVQPAPPGAPAAPA